MNRSWDLRIDFKSAWTIYSPPPHYINVYIRNGCSLVHFILIKLVFTSPPSPFHPITPNCFTLSPFSIKIVSQHFTLLFIRTIYRRLITHRQYLTFLGLDYQETRFNCTHINKERHRLDSHGKYLQKHRWIVSESCTHCILIWFQLGWKTLACNLERARNCFKKACKGAL